MAILAARAREEAGGGLRHRLRRRWRMRSVLREVAAQRHPHRQQRRRRQPARLRRGGAGARPTSWREGAHRVVEGDDVAAAAAALRGAGTLDMSSGEPLPQTAGDAPTPTSARCRSRAALAAGADIVITGRCVDSAVTLGALMHEFGWRADDFDRLAARQPRRPHHRMRLPGDRRLASPTGRTCPTGPNIGYPDRRVPRRRQLRRHQAARHRRARAPRGGRRATAVRDRRSGRLPAARRGLRLPPGAHGAGRAASRARDRRARPRRRPHLQGVGDGACWLQVLRAAGHRRHRCRGQGQAHRRGAARARPPAARESGFADFPATHIELLGTESLYGPHARTRATREVDAARRRSTHADAARAGDVRREIAPRRARRGRPAPPAPAAAGPRVSPVLRQFALLLPKEQVRPSVTLGRAPHGGDPRHDGCRCRDRARWPSAEPLAPAAGTLTGGAQARPCRSCRSPSGAAATRATSPTSA